MRLSIVSSMYCSAPYLPEFHARVSAAAKRITDDYEFILVNDGSPDESLHVALRLQAQDPQVRVIDLSRNFGHHPAMWTGLQHARGDWVFLIDCDLEEAPEWLELFADKEQATGADLIYGVQEKRLDHGLSRWGGWLFYKLFNVLSEMRLPENLMTVRLMSRRFVDALLSHHEASFTIAPLSVLTGFVQIGVPVPKQRRPGTTYNFARRVSLLVHNVTAYSNKPLVVSFYLGVLIMLMSMFAAGGLIVAKLFFDTIVSGWPSLMVSIWMLSGLVLFGQGVQGIYLAKIYLEVKRRPVAIVRHLYDGSLREHRPSLRMASVEANGDHHAKSKPIPVDSVS